MTIRGDKQKSIRAELDAMKLDWSITRDALTYRIEAMDNLRTEMRREVSRIRNSFWSRLFTSKNLLIFASVNLLILMGAEIEQSVIQFPWYTTIVFGIGVVFLYTAANPAPIEWY